MMADETDAPGKLAVLHGLATSSASWRVRIALNLKGVAYRQQRCDLRAGEQRGAAFLALNPQGLVPALEIDGLVLTQSLAICEYLDETRPGPPLLGGSPAERARIRALAQVIACDTHPLQNLKVKQALRASCLGEEGALAWAQRFTGEGLAAFAALAERLPGPFAAGARPSLADICLIPHLGNARRDHVEIGWPRLREIEDACAALPAFAAARPENQ